MVTPVLAAVVAAFVVAQEPAGAPEASGSSTPPSSSTSLPSPSSSPPSGLVPELADCRVLVDAGHLNEARACYQRVADDDPAHAALARSLAALVAPTVEREEPAAAPSSSSSLHAPPGASSSPLSLDALAWHGRGELIASATLTGGAASLAAVGALTMYGGPVSGGLALAAPVLGGGVAGAITTAGFVAYPHANDGDVHLIRAGLWAGAFDAVCVAAALGAMGGVESRAVWAAMPLTWGAVSGAAIAGASMVDVDDAAPSLGLSFLWIGALSTGVGFAMADLPAAYPANPWPLVAATTGIVGTAAGVGGIVVGNALHLTRASVWLVDVGAGVGALSAYGLATGLGAGTPALGWGTVLGGTLLGAGGGLLAARWVSTAPNDATPLPLIVLAPTLLPRLAENGRVDMLPGAALTAALP
jgi:hypothetical protein